MERNPTKPINPGDKYGIDRMLTVVGLVGTKNHRRYYACTCGWCGGTVDVRENRLETTRSCGCQKSAAISKTLTTHGRGAEDPTYRSWTLMRRRCLTPTSDQYENYGGRGIKICPEWDDFEVFLRDMGERPEGMTIERKDTNGNYSKSNCKWATDIEQANNRRDNVRITLGGVTKTMTEWSREYGISNRLVGSRIRAGWSPIEALTTPSAHSKQTEAPKQAA